MVAANYLLENSPLHALKVAPLQSLFPHEGQNKYSKNVFRTILNWTL